MLLADKNNWLNHPLKSEMTHKSSCKSNVCAQILEIKKLS